MRFATIALSLFLALSLTANVVIVPTTTQSLVDISKSMNASDITPLLSWTSRTQIEPLPITNGSTLVGDHVVVNATFPEELNVTRSELTIWNGFIFNVTRPLVIPTDPGGVFEGIIDPLQFDWITIPGIEAGLLVNITCDFTNSDSDFMAWPDSIAPSERTYANNVLHMSSGDKPEHDLIRWPETGSMHLACLDYSGEAGNWTLYLEVGARWTNYANGSSVSMDTYYLDGTNATYDILATGYSSSNETYQMMREDVLICNFFAPEVTIYPIEIIEGTSDYNKAFNCSWSTIDRNSDDVNYYSLWLSNNNGMSYMLLAQNLTRSWYVWNASGWMESSYSFRVRAYSLDFTVQGTTMDVGDPPAGYWPGDFGDGFSSRFEAGIPICPDFNDVGVHPAYDINYLEGETGNVIIWDLYFIPDDEVIMQNLDFQIYCTPSMISYSVFRNGTLINEHSIGYYSDKISQNVDGLSGGVYNYTLCFRNSRGIVRDTVMVIVTPIQTLYESSLLYIGLFFLIFSFPSVVLFVVFKITGKGFDRDIIKRQYDYSKIRLKSILCTVNVRGQWRVNCIVKVST